MFVRPVSLVTCMCFIGVGVPGDPSVTEMCRC
jgi:hypothetical protein